MFFLLLYNPWQSKHNHRMTSHTHLFLSVWFPSRYWWSWPALSHCRSWCVGCFSPSVALTVASSSPVAQSAPLPSSNAAKLWITSPSAGPSTATCCRTPRTQWSVLCLDTVTNMVLTNCYRTLVSKTDCCLQSKVFWTELQNRLRPKSLFKTGQQQLLTHTLHYLLLWSC